MRSESWSDSGEGRRATAEALVRDLSVAQAIVDVVNGNSKGRTVVGVEVNVGRSSDVVPETLDFAFLLLTEGTALDGAELQIARVAGGEVGVGALRLSDERERSEQIDRGRARPF